MPLAPLVLSHLFKCRSVIPDKHYNKDNCEQTGEHVTHPSMGNRIFNKVFMRMNVLILANISRNWLRGIRLELCLASQSPSTDFISAESLTALSRHAGHLPCMRNYL